MPDIDDEADRSPRGHRHHGDRQGGQRQTVTGDEITIVDEVAYEGLAPAPRVHAEAALMDAEPAIP